jgi:hypothetical protein
VLLGQGAEEVLATDEDPCETDLGQSWEGGEAALGWRNQKMAEQTISKNESFFDPDGGKRPKGDESQTPRKFLCLKIWGRRGPTPIGLKAEPWVSRRKYRSQGDRGQSLERAEKAKGRICERKSC